MAKSLTTTLPSLNNGLNNGSYSDARSMPLKEYLENAFGGDIAVQTELYNNWYKILYSYFMRRLRNRESTLDCISDLFTKMYNSSAVIEECSVFEKYLYKVANTVLLDFVRKNKNVSISIDDDSLIVTEKTISKYTAEDRAQQSLLSKQIKEIFNIMNNRDAEIIRLRLLEELEYEEISHILDINLDATRKAYSRALKKFETAYSSRFGIYEF